MPKQPSADYEEVTYTNNAFPATHPVALATVASLYDVTPPPIDNCRVLELGCGRGGNLLPMAESLPNGEFVGIDLSRRQIDEANAGRDELKLTNVSFKTMDICHVEPDLGEFDFVIAHGVYSWVPPRVQDELLRVCHQNLADNGLAYVSYNTYPGWHYRGVVGDLLSQFIDRESSATDQVTRARQLLESMANGMPDPSGLRTQLVVEEIQTLLNQADGYLYHDHLEPDNRPCYFRQFIAHAKQHDLRFIAEAQVNPLQEGVSPQARQSLEPFMDDVIRREQLLDFLVHRTFRRSILGHGVGTPQPQICADRIPNCWVISSSRPAESVQSTAPDAPVTFITPAGDSMTTNHPLVKSTLLLLSERQPQAVSFHQLAEEVAQRLGTPASDELSSTLAELVAATYRRGAVQLRLRPAEFCPHVTPKPIASPIARMQARGDSRVTNREHRSIDLDAFDRLLLSILDGESDQDTVIAHVQRELRNNNADATAIRESLDTEGSPNNLRDAILRRMDYLAETGFLIG